MVAHKEIRLTISPGEEVMEEAVAVTLSGIWQITAIVLILNHLLYTVKSPDGRPFGFTKQKALWGKPTLRALAVGIQARDLSVLAFSITLIPERISMRRDAPPLLPSLVFEGSGVGQQRCLQLSRRHKRRRDLLPKDLSGVCSHPLLRASRALH